MPDIVKAITPEEIIARRLERDLPSIEALNRATIMINGRLGQLAKGEELDFSFIREGFGHDILHALAARYQMAGWTVVTYQERGVDTGILISWK